MCPVRVWASSATPTYRAFSNSVFMFLYVFQYLIIFSIKAELVGLEIIFNEIFMRFFLDLVKKSVTFHVPSERLSLSSYPHLPGFFQLCFYVFQYLIIFSIKAELVVL